MNDSVKGVGAVSLGVVGVGGGNQSGIDADRFARARDFMLRNARLVDRHLFACLFEGASNEPIRDALRAYRNPDGGFGNALEPDKRCPESQPVDAEVALKTLDLVDGFDDPMVVRRNPRRVSVETYQQRKAEKIYSNSGRGFA